jgi:hypothetical protein
MLYRKVPANSSQSSALNVTESVGDVPPDALFDGFCRELPPTLDGIPEQTSSHEDPPS